MSRKILLTLLIAAVLSLGACKKVQEEVAAAQNPYPKSSPLHEPLDRMLRKLVNDPRYVALLKQGDKAQAQRAGFELAQKGISRLDHATLEQRLEILAAVSEKVDVPKCALLARGGNPNDARAMSATMLQGLETLPPAQIDQWFEISLKATDAQLSNTPPQTVAPADVQAAMTSLINALPSDQQQRLVKVLPQMAQASDADACWAARTLYTQALAAKEPVRGQLAWVLAQQ
ncbi:hypothetical protein KCU57_09375 [Xanthomonas translucens]|uniref:hypothetical protein n=1 Tax=Xanthomonas campestris pv. translucens TaxID=343 RepID=UPI001F253482|nr:hypothetical protein [Xanthomonas translucens]UKE52439.1 hypothetical protein KCU57_09375 [Xanthomonas translucens]